MDEEIDATWITCRKPRELAEMCTIVLPSAAIVLGLPEGLPPSKGGVRDLSVDEACREARTGNVEADVLVNRITRLCLSCSCLHRGSSKLCRYPPGCLFQLSFMHTPDYTPGGIGVQKIEVQTATQRLFDQ